MSQAQLLFRVLFLLLSRRLLAILENRRDVGQESRNQDEETSCVKGKVPTEERREGERNMYVLIPEIINLPQMVTYVWYKS